MKWWNILEINLRILNRFENIIENEHASSTIIVLTSSTQEVWLFSIRIVYRGWSLWFYNIYVKMFKDTEKV